MERNVAQGIEGIVVEGNVAAGALEHLEHWSTGAGVHKVSR